MAKNSSSNRTRNSALVNVWYWICMIVLVMTASIVHAQTRMIDRVVAVVGKNVVLQSELETQYQQYIAQGNAPDPDFKCSILDQLMFQKLMINQADIDSVTVGDAQVDGELERRIRYFVAQIGSEQKLEEYYKKPIAQIKEDFRDVIKDQILAQTMQSKITKDVTAGPSDVRMYYDQIAADSIPYVNSELEIAQITRFPIISAEQKNAVKEQLEEIRTKILGGRDFAVMAGLYSQDPGSAKKGGELGFVNRGDLVPEFASVAFSIKPGEVSKVVESSFGFHIIQLIERRGSQVNVRHILLKPAFSQAALKDASKFLDSVRTNINNGVHSFSESAQLFSDDSETKNNGGLMMNAGSGNTRFETDQLDPALFFIVDKMKKGDVSEPMLFQTADGKQGYRLLFLKTRTAPHRANLRDDYQRIQAAALSERQNTAISEWVSKKRKTTYIRVDKDFQACDALSEWNQ